MVCLIGLTALFLRPSEYWVLSSKIHPSAIFYTNVFIFRIIEYAER